jgi:phosphate-selective porin
MHDHARAVLALAAWCAAVPAQEPAPVPGSPAPWTAGYDGAFFLRSPDQRTELTLGGLFQVGGNFFQPGRGRTSEFDLRRMRPELGGDIHGFRFVLEPKFTEDEVELEEAWVGVDLDGGAHRLMLGRMKAPFGLEEVRSRRHIHFPRFSILNRFSPAEDHGAFVNGRFGAWEYGTAVYNGTGGADTQSSSDVAARLMLHPCGGADSCWRNLGLGIAGTWGRQDADVSGDPIGNETGQDLMVFAPGARLHGDRARLGLELQWFHGPVMVQAELLGLRQRMEQGASADQVQFRGGSPARRSRSRACGPAARWTRVLAPARAPWCWPSGTRNCAPTRACAIWACSNRAPSPARCGPRRWA